MNDEIRLTLPRERDFYGVAHLVVGGLAARLDMTVEELEDLGLALDGLLTRHEADDDVTVAVRLDGGALRASVGPFHGSALATELAAAGEEDWSLRRVLETVADSFEVGERDGAQWVDIVKTIQAASPGG